MQTVALSSSDDAFLTASQIVKALDRKRHQLDVEIARFTAWKESEYTAHEKWLRTTARQRDLKSTGQDLALGEEKEGKEGTQAIPTREGSEGGSSEAATAASALASALNNPSKQTSSSVPKVPEPEHEHEHEHDEDFVGIFHPPFLPLLDVGGNNVVNNRNGAHPPILSSAQNPAAPSISPDTPNKSDDDHHPHATQPLDHPLFSTPTTPPPAPTTTPRRSSFRHHPNLPTSPKRVMLALPNASTVVSPGTSPLVERKAAPQPMHGGRKKAARSGGAGVVGEEFEIVRRKGRGGGRKKRQKDGNGERGREGGGLGNGSGAAGLLGGRASQGRDYDPVGWEEAGGEEGLFEFDDEGLGFGSSPPGAKAGPTGLGEALSMGNDEEEVGLELEQAVAGAGSGSPRAGSLPIEIRWPEGRGRGGWRKG